jgi:hypothetical protein
MLVELSEKEARVSDMVCPHCGQPHSAEVLFCPTTGGQVRAAAEAAAAAAAPPAGSSGSPAVADDKGVADLLMEALNLYRKHARALLMTSAVVFVPVSILSSLALAAIGPTAVGAIGIGFLYGVAISLTTGALTIAAADRVLGGSADWRQVWSLLAKRLGLLLSALVPAGVVFAIGMLLLVIPGLIAALLFALVAPVVLIEGLRGTAALKRSVELVRSDWLRVALVILVFGLLTGLARLLAYIIIRGSAVFALALFSDLFTLVLLPVPVLGLALLYFDIRRKRDGFTSDRLRADLEALKSAA